MSAILLSGPAVEPVTMAALRQHLRLGTGDDDLLVGLISAARMTVEAQSGLRLIDQKWRMLIDQWPQDLLPISLRPVRAVSFIGLTGSRVSLPAGAYELQQTGERAYVQITANDLPMPTQSRFGIAIDVTAGYGSDLTDVPEDLRFAVLSLAAQWYHQEDWTQSQGGAVMPDNIALLLDNRRRMQL